MILKQPAHNLRKNQTDAEKILWRYLRDRRLNGYKFRRQYYIEQYIADFVCLEKRLIVEVDGGQHSENVEADKKWTEILERKGFQVIRFWNNEILGNIDGVLTVINEILLTLNSLSR